MFDFEFEDEPEDVKYASPVQSEIQRGQHFNVDSDVDPGEIEYNGEVKKYIPKVPEMIKATISEPLYKVKKQEITPRNFLTRREHIKMLAAPSKKYSPLSEKREIWKKAIPITLNIKRLALPSRRRILTTLEESSDVLPLNKLENLVKMIEEETCLTPEQTEDIINKPNCSLKKKRHLKCKSKRQLKGKKKPSIRSMDKEAVTYQHLLAQRFVKNMLEWKCDFRLEDYQDISKVVFKRICKQVNYVPAEYEDRKSEQIKFLADIIAGWVYGIMFELAEEHKDEIRRDIHQDATKENIQPQTEESIDESSLESVESEASATISSKSESTNASTSTEEIEDYEEKAEIEKVERREQEDEKRKKKQKEKEERSQQKEKEKDEKRRKKEDEKEAKRKQKEEEREAKRRQKDEETATKKRLKEKKMAARRKEKNALGSESSEETVENPDNISDEDWESGSVEADDSTYMTEKYSSHSILTEVVKILNIMLQNVRNDCGDSFMYQIQEALYYEIISIMYRNNSKTILKDPNVIWDICGKIVTWVIQFISDLDIKQMQRNIDQMLWLQTTFDVIQNWIGWLTSKVAHYEELITDEVSDRELEFWKLDFSENNKHLLEFQQQVSLKLKHFTNEICN